MFGSKIVKLFDDELERAKSNCFSLANQIGYKIIVDEAGNVWLNKGTTCEKVIGWYNLEQRLNTEFVLKLFR